MTIAEGPSSIRPAKIRTDEFDRMADAGVFGPERQRLELIGGQLYEMPPIGTAHLVVVTRLQAQLNPLNALGRLLVQQPIRMPEFNELQPDLTVLLVPLGTTKPGARDCELVIEVSDTTLQFDRDLKVQAYKSGGVPRVWIVNVRQGVVEEYGTPTWGRDVHRPGQGRLSIGELLVDVEALFADLPIGGE